MVWVPGKQEKERNAQIDNLPAWVSEFLEKWLLTNSSVPVSPEEIPAFERNLTVRRPLPPFSPLLCPSCALALAPFLVHLSKDRVSLQCLLEFARQHKGLEAP